MLQRKQQGCLTGPRRSGPLLGRRESKLAKGTAASKLHIQPRQSGWGAQAPRASQQSLRLPCFCQRQTLLLLNHSWPPPSRVSRRKARRLLPLSHLVVGTGQSDLGRQRQQKYRTPAVRSAPRLLKPSGQGLNSNKRHSRLPSV